MKPYLSVLILIFSCVLHSCQGDRLISQQEISNAYPKSGKVWGFLNEEGEVAIPLKFQEVKDFHEGRAAFRSGHLWGYLDTNGSVIVKPIYNQAFSFSNGFARVINAEDRTIFIDTSGKVCFPLYVAKAGNFKNNRAAIWQDGVMGYINTTGQSIITPKFEDGFVFNQEIAIVKIQEKYGLVDLYGAFLLEPNFNFIYRDPNSISSIFLVQDSSETRYFDTDSRKFLLGRFAGGKAFYALNAVAKQDRLFGAINTKGEWILQPIFSDLINLGHKRWAIQYEGIYYMIDSTGLQHGEGFKQLYRFSEGLAVAQIDNNWGFINETGSFVIPPKYELIWPFKNGKARVVTANGVGFIDRKGQFVIPPILGDVRDFSGGLARFNVEE